MQPKGCIQERRALTSSVSAGLRDRAGTALANHLTEDAQDELFQFGIDISGGRNRESAWNALLTRFIFRHGLLRAAYTREQLERMAATSHFGRHEIVARGVGLELRLIKAA